MNPERWRKIERLYHEAATRPASERSAFLDHACRADQSLRSEVESLLQQAGTAGGFLNEAAANVAARMMDSAGNTSLTGQRLGVYHLQERIGAGGRGEVYRARDTRLGRDVAIKILPRALTSDSDRLAASNGKRACWPRSITRTSRRSTASRMARPRHGARRR